MPTSASRTTVADSSIGRANGEPQSPSGAGHVTVPTLGTSPQCGRNVRTSLAARRSRRSKERRHAPCVTSSTRTEVTPGLELYEKCSVPIRAPSHGSCPAPPRRADTVAGSPTLGDQESAAGFSSCRGRGRGSSGTRSPTCKPVASRSRRQQHRGTPRSAKHSPAHGGSLTGCGTTGQVVAAGS